MVYILVGKGVSIVPLLKHIKMFEFIVSSPQTDPINVFEGSQPTIETFTKQNVCSPLLSSICGDNIQERFLEV
jgi:hypothetical protein